MPKPPGGQSQLSEFVARFANPEVAKSNSDIKRADAVVCVLASAPKYFPDNVFDFCCRCGEEVQLRPDVPKGPKRICYGCVEIEMKDDDDVRVMISKKTVEELAKRKQ